MTVNKIRDAQLAERILQEGKADLISMARTLIADPDFPKKSAEGRFDDIRPCISCTQCSQKISEGLPLSCTVNPMMAKEREITITPASTSRDIAIIGGGPAGMEAAIAAARRGHKVTIYEKDEQLGGRLLVAVKPPGKADIEKLANYLRKQVNKLGVAVKLGKEVDSESIERLKPDAVIVATGGTPLIPEIPGIESRNVVTALEVLEGKVKVGKKVVIIGGGQVGLETAEYLGEMGKSITVVEMLDEVGRGMPRIPKIALISKLERLKVGIVIRAEVERITNQGVIINHMGKREEMLADTVVSATGLSPNQEIAKKLKNKVRELYCIGDSVEPRTILEAIHEGFAIGLKI
jgi:NADPH-dependent 2,4-dienoyl-CoA reductase/sulfur reductase-like enzyme